MRTLVFTVLAVTVALLSCGLLWAGATKTKDPLSVGFVYISPADDGGWSTSHDRARQALDQRADIVTHFKDKVAEGADTERAIQELLDTGCQVVITTSFGYLDTTIKMASRHPRQTFLHCSGYKTAPNMSVFFGRMYQARYLTGLVAGSMTRTNSIGYVAGFPIPEVIRGINAFTLGVREANPDAVVRVHWTKTWYDPPLERQGAFALLDKGADVIAQHQDSPEPQMAAQTRGKYSVGYHSDMSAKAPDAHLVAAVWNWTPFYSDMADKVIRGTWKSGSFWLGMEAGIVDISPFGPMVPEKVKSLVLARKADIASGRFTVFSGPVKDQQGTLRVPAGAFLDDRELLEMNWFVQGVAGVIP